MPLLALCYACAGPVPLEEFYCPGCDALVPPHPSATHYDYLGIPPSPKIPAETLERAYMDRLQEVHPDRFLQVQQRMFATQWSSGINQAYIQLKSPVDALIYWLKIHHTGLDELALPTTTLAKLVSFEEQIEDCLSQIQSTPHQPSNAAVPEALTSSLQNCYDDCLKAAFNLMEKTASNKAATHTSPLDPKLLSRIYILALEALFWDKMARRYAINLKNQL